MAYLLMIIILLLVAGGQTLLKRGIQIGVDKGKNRILSLFHPLVIFAAILVLITPVLYVKVVSLLGLSDAFGLNAINYPLIFILSRVFLKENSNPWHWSGLILITAGVFTWSL